MSILDELNTPTTTPVNLDDLISPDQNPPRKIGNTASNRNRAAYVASLSENPEDVVPTFEEVAIDYETVGESPLGDEIVQNAKDVTRAESEGAVIEALASPNISDEAKVEIARQFREEDGFLYEPRTMVANRTLSRPSGEESVESELVRIDVAGAIKEIHDYQNDVQSLLNAETAKVDASAGEAFLEIFGMISPFVEQTYSQEITRLLQEAGTGDLSRLTSFALLGSGKEAVIGALKKMPPAERLSFAETLIKAVNTATGNISLTDQNDFAKVQFLRTYLEEGNYGTTDKYIDNVVSVLDLIGLGGLARNTIRGVRGVVAGEDTVRGVKRQFVRTHAQPTAPANTYKNTNPETSRAMHEAAASDETGQVAEAIYGTNRMDAVAGDLAPNVLRVDSHVQVRTHNPAKAFEQEMTPDAEIIDMVVNRDGATRFTDGEKKRVRARVFNDIKNATGLTLRNEATAVGRDVDDSVRIQAVYGQTEGGFSDGLLAVEHTAFALRDLGVTFDDITLLQRRGEEYVPVPIDGPLPQGDYLTSVNYDYKFNPADVTDWDHFSVKRNLFDRAGIGLSERFGTLQRNVMDPFSTLDPRMTLPANSTVDKVAGLEQKMLELGKRYTDRFVKLDKNSRQAVTQYIKEANANGVPFRESDLIARGFGGKEIEALKEWRRYWDTQYWLENRDLSRTLRNRGYKEFVDASSDTRLIARPITKGAVGDSARVYNPKTGAIEVLDRNAVEALYEQGGTVAKLRTPISQGDEMAEHIVSFENTASGYLRALSDWDQVLNYRHGYYQVQYSNPKFVVQRVKDSSGKVLYEKAVATAGDTHEAVVQARRMAAHSGGRFDLKDRTADFYVRDDVKKMSVDSDDYWNLQVGAGRTAQRVRGQRLEDASSPVNFGISHNHILGPVDSLIASARSISSRVHMRDYLDTMKARFLDQYADVLPRDKYNQPVWPNRLAEISKPGRMFDKDLADARTSWEYINSLEVGYINSLDEAIRASLNALSHKIGEINATRGSKALSAAERFTSYVSEGPGVIDLAKNTAFTAYIALNPLRQIIVQAHQATLLAANFPKYVVGQGLANDLGAFMLMNAKVPDKAVSAASLRSIEELKEMKKAFEASGLASSIDKQSLIRGSLTQIVENQKYKGGRAGRAITSPIEISRRAGFDVGEYVNIAAAWLAYYDKFKTQKGTLTQADYDEIAGMARSYTLNMNRAGDMPYTQNLLGMVFQFMQVPHKMFLQMFNRSLTRAERARVTAYNTLMFGTVGYGGASVIESIFGDVLPEDPEVRNVVIQGLEGWMLNVGLSKLSGEETNVDWSGLAPQDMYGTMDFIHGLVTTDIGKILASSPSGQLFFGNNTRITDAFKTMARYFNVTDDYEGPEMVTKFSHVAEDFLSISSGYSNAMKANYLFKAGEKINTLGGTDPNRGSVMEALAKAAGFRSMDDAANQYLNNKLYTESKEFRDDVKAWFRDAKKQALRDKDASEEDHIIRITGEAWRVFGDAEPLARQIVLQELKKSIAEKDATIFNRMMKTAQWMSPDEFESMLHNLPNYDPEKRDLLLKNLQNYRQMRETK